MSSELKMHLCVSCGSFGVFFTGLKTPVILGCLEYICPGTLSLWFFLSESWGWRVMEVGKVVLGGGYEGLIASLAWDQYECQHPTMSWPQFILMSRICHNCACNLHTKPIAKFRDVFTLGHPLYNPLWPSNSKSPFCHGSVNFIICKILFSMGIIGPKKWMTSATYRTYGHGPDSGLWGWVKNCLLAFLPKPINISFCKQASAFRIRCK